MVDGFFHAPTSSKLKPKYMATNLTANLTAKFEKVTPDKARDYLLFSNGNRDIDKQRFDLYVSEMKTGKWVTNTDAIGFDDAGVLINGHHRLNAVLLSGTTQVFLVARGFPHETFANIDTGKSRSSGDILAIQKIPNSKNVASIISSALKFKAGRATLGFAKHAIKLTNTQVNLEYSKAPEYWQEIYKKVMKWYADLLKIATPSFIGGLFIMLSEIDESAAEEFFEKLCTGTHLEPRSPIKILRDNMVRAYRAKDKQTDKTKYCEFIKAWNFFRVGKEISLLKWASTESVPKPI